MTPQEKRRHERYSSSHHVDIEASTGVTKTYITLDLSDGGIFVLAAISDQLAVGTEVGISPTWPVSGEQTPAVRGRIARRSSLGMGIEFLDAKFA